VAALSALLGVPVGQPTSHCGLLNRDTSGVARVIGTVAVLGVDLSRSRGYPDRASSGRRKPYSGPGFMVLMSG
ncbi:MAG: hypothetical protein ACRDQV_18435, partial [Pseudonocardiaceae bacterium]